MIGINQNYVSLGWMAGSIVSIIIPSTSLFNCIHFGGMFGMYSFIVNEYLLDKIGYEVKSDYIYYN